MSANIPDQEKKEAQEVLKSQERRKTERSVTESTWQECMQYIVPRKGDVIAQLVPGDKRGHELFDSTAITANGLLASALHGMLTNPSTRFFELILNDPELGDDEEVKGWLEKVADILFLIMNNSNFQTEVHEIYIDLGAIGTACMFIGDHKDSLVHFAARPMKEIYIDEDNLGRIDTVGREFKWKPRQVIQEFGEKNLNPWVMEQYKKGCEDDWTIVHEVCPDAEYGKGANFAYLSRYVLKDEPMVLSRGGFREFPYAVPRWTKTSGEKYGRGPGMDTLPDTKMVNKMMETTLKGAQLTVGMPLQAEDDSVIGRVKMTPFGVTVVRQGSQIKPLFDQPPRIDFGYQAVEDVRKRIRQGFFLPQVQLNDAGPQKTATETNAIVEEQLRFMGPVLGRQYHEFLRPVIERLYKMAERAGKIPTPPAVIKQKGFDVRYSSLVARAQRMSEGQNLTRAIQVASPIINAKPETLDVLNGDAAVRHIFDIYGVPQKLFNKQRDIQKTRDARAAATQQKAQELQQQHQAELVGKAGPAVAQLQQAAKQE